MLRSDNRHRDSYLRPTERYQCRPARRLSLVCLNWLALSLSETYALKYWWCSPPRTGIASVRPTVWTARGIGASLCGDVLRASRFAIACPKNRSQRHLSLPKTGFERIDGAA